MSERCIHDLILDQCSDCKIPPRAINEFVYVTEQGQAFHNWRDCAFLIAGQEFAERKGFNTHPVVARKWSSVYSSKGACEWCCAVHLIKNLPDRESVVRINGEWVPAYYVRDRHKSNNRREVQVVLKNSERIELVDEEDFKH